MAESITHRAIHRLVDRAAGALISRRTLVRSAVTSAAAISLPSEVFAQATPRRTRRSTSAVSTFFD